MGPLSDRFGRRPVILAGLAIFCLASLGCVLADDAVSFLAFRMLQAAIISGHAVSQAVIRDSHGPQRAASLMGYVAMAWAIAPMLGPMAGGVLDQYYGWRACFWAFAVLGAGLLCLSLFDLRETNTSPSSTLVRQLRAYPDLLRSVRFWGYALCMAFSSGGFFAFLGGAPLVATAWFGVSSSELGLYIGSTTVGFILGSFLAGRFSGKCRLTTMMIAGRLVACTGLASGLTILLLGGVHAAVVFGACICMGIGNGMTMPSSSAGAMSVRPGLAGSAAGMVGALMNAGAAAISALTGAVLTAANAGYGMLGMMLLASALALAAAVAVRIAERGENEQRGPGRQA